MLSTLTTAPAKQSVSETIPILSGRLSTATLLEDRRAAILGLRSFAKQYPASVASGALRSLIGSLDRDGEDVDTVKVVLETLLYLFEPDPDSPEASPEIAMWVADEFTMRHENIGLLLGFLDRERLDFYSRLYSLQLLAAVLSARPERTEECIVNAEDGIARIVAALDEQREPIRDAAVGLLTDLTPISTVIQGLVAFENVFGRVFGIVRTEGGLAGGAEVVVNCLILMANLLRLNPTNQAMFRDMGYLAEVSRLLKDAYGGPQDLEELPPRIEELRNRSVFALLAVIRLFLVPGASVTPQNQEAFLGDLLQPERGRGGRTSRARGDPILVETLQIAFSPVAEISIKSEALLACADMIRGHAPAQEVFAGIQVPSPLADLAAANGQGPQANGGIPRVYVIDGLLDLVLAVNSLQAFDLRLAGCVCLKAYFYEHAQVRMHFLDHAIRAHQANADQLTNVLTILLQPTTESLTGDPYKYWFAAVLMLHLLRNNPEAKSLARGVTEGDEANGEEVVTSIQTIAAHLLSCVAKSEDPRVIVGYLMLLLCWLFEDLPGVNDFLDEFTNLQGLIQAAIENPHGDVTVQGLSAMLAGVIYEFSTKDSPVPRATVREMIMTRMGRDRYVDKLSKLRSHPLMRDYEVLPQKLEPGLDQKLPDVFFDDAFVEFFKDNYSRILRAIDREPDAEVSVVINGVEEGVSRKLVDELREEIAQKETELRDLLADREALSKQLSQEQAAHAQTKTLQSTDLARTNETLTALRAQLATKDRAIQAAEAQKANVVKQLTAEQSEHQRARADLARATETANTLRTQLAVKDKTIATAETQLTTLRQQLAAAQGSAQQASAEISRLKAANDALQRTHGDEIRRVLVEHEATEENLQRQLAAASKTSQEETERIRRELEAGRKSAEQEAERVKRRLEGEQADLKATISRLEVDLMKAQAEGGKKVGELEGRLKKEGEMREKAERRVREVEEGGKKERAEKDKELKKVRGLVEEKEKERKAAQGELDDLLMVFGDLEEKVNKYKERLKALGETISDDEDDDDEEEDVEDDDDDDEDEDEEEEEEEEKGKKK
ncbi:Vesicle-mediated ER to Golgi transport protein [Podospora pseudocomata]|uniref:Vesicle-mediated ER to Golgi transport protein n=1 Tax=Podospora pseudocomata TaxID=2093779 RepID=A0ABR0G6J8_9PEZI|nr:Vesicle-mediated ER to Golgi transport protein [Podospora pseudocomata]